MTSKDAYYFPHFSNARHDRKVKRIIKELGVEGYGIYFMTLEVLREQTELRYPLDDIDLLADEFRTSEQKVRTVVCNYGLFEIDDEKMFFSPKLFLYLEPYFRMKTQRIEAGKKSAEARKQRTLQQPFNDRSTTDEQSKVKKSKVKESKEKRFTPPTVDDVKQFCSDTKKHIDAERFVNFYQSKGWMVGKNKMKDWKAAVNNWARESKGGEVKQRKGMFENRPEDL